MKNDKSVSRKKFLSFSVALASLAAIPSFFLFTKNNKKKPVNNTTKMLTQDGKLVEIDLSKISHTKQKVNDNDIHTWIKNKPGF